MEYCALIVAVTFAGISKRFKGWMELLEPVVGFNGTRFKNDDHKSHHEECSIRHFVLICGTVVENASVVLAVHFVEFSQLTAISMDHS
jgi:hypothetical protein